jgi:hypothetical protein
MFSSKPGFNFSRPNRILLAWMALGISCLAQSNPRGPSGGIDPSNPGDKLFIALGMIESGNDDRGIGRAGEVSRYQIHPAVWKNYSESRDYQNPESALQVARQHWNYLTNYFRDRAGREPTPFDMYVLWNTRFGHYARKGFDRARLSPVIRERAQRFVNLVNR